MRVAGEVYGRFTGTLLMALALAANWVAGRDSSIDEVAIEKHRAKASRYSQGLEITSGRQLPYQG
jgi:hypothetical protein